MESLCASITGSGIISAVSPAGIAEHHTLIARAERCGFIRFLARFLFRGIVDAERDIRRLTVHRERDFHRIGIERAERIPDFTDWFRARRLRNRRRRLP